MAAAAAHPSNRRNDVGRASLPAICSLRAKSTMSKENKDKIKRESLFKALLQPSAKAKGWFVLVTFPVAAQQLLPG